MDEGEALGIGVRNPADPFGIIWVKFDQRIDLGANRWVRAIIGHSGNLHVATVPPGTRWARRQADANSAANVVVRIGCRRCSRKGAYRLARLAAKFGPEITLRDLTKRFSYDCMWRAEYLPDLEHKRPPDLPPGMVKLRLVKSD